MDNTIILTVGQFVTLCLTSVLMFYLGKFIGGLKDEQSRQGNN